MFIFLFFILFFFFFKQKTAYEMLLCDWSSDVCSSDLCLQCDLAPGVNVKPGGANACGVLACHGVLLAPPGVSARSVGRDVLGQRVSRAPREEADETAGGQCAGNDKPS